MVLLGCYRGVPDVFLECSRVLGDVVGVFLGCSRGLSGFIGVLGVFSECSRGDLGEQPRHDASAACGRHPRPMPCHGGKFFQSHGVFLGMKVYDNDMRLIELS